MQLPVAFHQVCVLFRRVEISLYIYFYFFFFSIFSLFYRFRFLISNESSDLNGNSEQDECKSKLKIISEFQWNLGTFLDFVFLFFSFDDNFNEFV